MESGGEVVTYLWNWRGGGMGYVKNVASGKGAGRYSNRRWTMMQAEDGRYPVDFEFENGSVLRSVYDNHEEAQVAVDGFLTGDE